MDEETHIPESPILLLDRYRIDGMLGEGGLGTVYKAYDTRLKRFVAIKTLKRSVYSDDPEMFRILEERFQREAEAGSRMHVHPNLVVVHDFVTDTDKSLYLVQEFVPGGTLADRLARDGVLPQSDALRLAADVAHGLAAAHEMHIVHRDIKPANIFISADSRAKVGDFGIAQLDDLSGRTRATAGHPGTPLYMSPEQAGSSGYVRPESDQYSLGLVLFEMLTGQTYKRLRKRQAEELLSKQLQQIQILVRRMIAEEPDDRYESMNDVVTEIGRIERQLASTATSPPSSRSPIPADNMVHSSGQQRDVAVDYEPTLTQSDYLPQVPQTEQKTRRQTPRVNLQPIAAARMQPPPALPIRKSSGRRNVIVASSLLVLVVGSAVVFGMMRTIVAPSATTTLIAAVPSSAPSPIATTASAPLTIPLTASSTPSLSLPTPISSTSVPQSPVTVSDPFEYCAQVGQSDSKTFDTGPIRFAGTPPVPASSNQGNTLHYWRCYGGKVLVCDRNNGGFSPTCFTIDTSGVPSQNIIDYCATATTTAPMSLYTLGNTNYAWTCNGGKPVRGNQQYSQDELDEFGYVRRQWHTLDSTSAPPSRIEATATSVPSVKPATAVPTPTPQPSMSYPGKIVYATADNQVYVTDADGKERVKIGIGQSPVFSPDGSKVAFLCQAEPSKIESPFAVCTEKLDGSDMKRQCEVALASAAGLVRWSPGGRFIAVSVGQNTVGAIQMCDIATGKLLDQLQYGQGSVDGTFDWTPDGNYAVWQSGYFGTPDANLYYGDPNKFGKDAVRLTNGQNRLPSDAYYPCARVSPNGQTIAVAGTSVFFLGVPGQRSPLDGTSLRGVSNVRWLAWSPDGKALALMTIPNPKTWTLTIVDVASGQARVITSGSTGFSGREAIDWSRQ